jgi:hypothetical protein
MTARIGAPKTGGRRRGSLDKGERQVVTAEMAGDLLAVYKKLGGVKWLLKFAQDNPKEFLQQGLSRLFPAPQKDDADVVQNNQINIGNLSETEAAIRVAFALSKAIYPDPSLAPPVRTVERVDTPEPITPQQACDWRNPTPPCTPPAEPEPVDDPARRQWAESLKLTTDQKLVRDTHVESLSSYAGSGPEQGGTVRQPSSRGDKPSAAQLCHRLSRRGRDLL